MAINKVVYQGDTLIDLTNDTVTAETLAEGITAHAKNGEVIVGSMINGGASVETCTVSVGTYSNDDEGAKAWYVALENGEMKAKSVSIDMNGATITDVVKGTILTIADNGTTNVVYDSNFVKLWQHGAWYTRACFFIDGNGHINAYVD